MHASPNSVCGLVQVAGIGSLLTKAIDQGQVCSEAAAIGAALIYAAEKRLTMTELGQQLGRE